jgi:hypothetical protein
MVSVQHDKLKTGLSTDFVDNPVGLFGLTLKMLIRIYVSFRASPLMGKANFNYVIT